MLSGVLILVDDHPKYASHASQDSVAVLWLGWIYITHVCQKWRTLVLDNPIFWTDIVVNLRVCWMMECFRRAKSLPISICANTECMPMELSHIPFIQYCNTLTASHEKAKVSIPYKGNLVDLYKLFHYFSTCQPRICLVHMMYP